MEYVFSAQWTLADPSEPSIQWIPRHRNQLADFLSTQTLVTKESWTHRFYPQLYGKRCNLVLFVDGWGWVGQIGIRLVNCSLDPDKPSAKGLGEGSPPFPARQLG